MRKGKILVSIGIIISATIGISAQNNRITREAERISGDTFSVRATTRLGASVLAVRQPSARVLNAIDAGLSNLFSAARRNGYRAKLNYSDYTIYIARADRQRSAATGQYSPDIAIGAAQYAGSAYDQGGYIYAAGIVVALNPCTFMIAEHTTDFNRVSEAVRNEGEHLVLYHNDRRLYNQTADHSRGGGHPILQ
jgi:hypothetical protein